MMKVIQAGLSVSSLTKLWPVSVSSVLVWCLIWEGKGGEGRKEGSKLTGSGSPLTIGATFCGRDPCI